MLSRPAIRNRPRATDRVRKHSRRLVRPLISFKPRRSASLTRSFRLALRVLRSRSSTAATSSSRVRVVLKTADVLMSRRASRCPTARDACRIASSTDGSCWRASRGFPLDFKEAGFDRAGTTKSLQQACESMNEPKLDQCSRINTADEGIARTSTATYSNTLVSTTSTSDLPSLVESVEVLLI
jgi:hypothetical protein